MLINLIKKILPPEEKIFYSLFNESIELACQASSALSDIYETGISEEKMEHARLLKERSNELTHRLLEHLSATFITPFDREDIQTVAVFINKITKKIVRVIKNSYYYNLDGYNESLKQQSQLLVKITDELKTAVDQLKSTTKAKDITESGRRMHELENLMDAEIKTALEELFYNNHDAMTILKLGQLYRDLESVGESCGTLSDITLNIVLKNS
ncbi:MAG: DUF47 family protein [Oligoflexia bacterium]|nr:DUF47 family protein [Oligoflexia bacterium]MBF0366666.1 DUF47 family protein [Oligoflexia bacterium]